MKDTRKGLLRGVGILAALLLAAGVISPAFSAAPLTKGKVKKIAKKQVKKVGPGLFIEETEFDRLGPITMNTGDPDQTLFTFGPFTATVRCDLDAGNVRAGVRIQTSEIGSYFSSYDEGDEEPFDPADGAILWIENTGDVPGGLTEGVDREHNSPAIALSPSGVSFSAMVRNIINPPGGSHCLFDGYVIDLGA